MPHLKVNKSLERIFFAPQQIIVVVGGRGSGKSIGIGDILTYKMDTERADIYCLREFMKSMTDSVHRVFEGSINNRLKLTGWDVQETKILAPNGARTVYQGANRNPDAMQSAQDFKYSWYEEAQKASQSSIDKLLPTILRNKGAKCIFTGNPQSSGDPFSQRFIVPYLDDLNTKGYYEDELHLIIKVNWRDNPWWNKEQETLRKWDEANLSRAKYLWIWEGEFNDEVEDSIIKAEWFDAAKDAHKLPHLEAAFKPHGAKIIAHDPSDLGKDSKGLVTRHGSIITSVKESKTGDVSDGCDWATGEAINQGVDWFVWDGDGMGTGLKGQISKSFAGKPIKYHMFRGSLSGSGQDNAGKIYMPSDGDEDTKPKLYQETFKNNRSQYYMELSRRFENTYKCVVKGEYIDPDEMISIDTQGVENIVKLRSEVCRIPLKKNSGGLKQIMSKDDMAKLKIDSPNLADSLMMVTFQPPIKKKATTFTPIKPYSAFQ